MAVLARFRAFVELYQLGPFTIALFAIFVEILNQYSSRANDDAVAPEHLDRVSGFYGPGTYYAWLLNAVAAACQSQPTTGTNANPAPAIDMPQLISTLGVAVYAGIAAVDYLERIYIGDLGPCHAAAHRVVQIAWIVSALYLLHHLLEGRPKIPSFQTTIWMLLWTLITVAMSIDNVVRGILKSTAIKVFAPFCIGIPLPLLVIAICQNREWIEPPRNADGRRIYTAILNIGTFLLSTIYLCSPRHLRYDSASPAAPLSGSKLSDLDQASALALGLLAVIPALPPLPNRGADWVRSWWP